MPLHLKRIKALSPRGPKDLESKVHNEDVWASEGMPTYLRHWL